jgi:hypothetical protein
MMVTGEDRRWRAEEPPGGIVLQVVLPGEGDGPSTSGRPDLKQAQEFLDAAAMSGLLKDDAECRDLNVTAKESGRSHAFHGREARSQRGFFC